jgi:hypothetical protein
MSMHKSGKILLALYANGVLRLWNMMEARCKFKRKVGTIESDNNSDNDEDADLEVDIKTKKDLNEIQRQAIEVKWEPSEGQVFAVLYNNMVEVYSVEESSDKPCV